MLGASDKEHMIQALKEKRVIFTQDVDFIRLHAKGEDHAGIVYTPQETAISEIIKGLILIYHVLDVEEMAGHIEYL